MTFNLLAVLPELAPKAIAWAQDLSAVIAESGETLDEDLLALARSVGVLHPERIRILEEPTLAYPQDPALRQAAIEAGLLGPWMAGLTLGYSVYICRGQRSVRLLSHEFRHVYQYEQAGSIAAFLAAYLHQIATVGYYASPFEVDARAHEKQA